MTPGNMRELGVRRCSQSRRARRAKQCNRWHWGRQICSAGSERRRKHCSGADRQAQSVTHSTPLESVNFFKKIGQAQKPVDRFRCAGSLFPSDVAR